MMREWTTFLYCILKAYLYFLTVLQIKVVGPDNRLVANEAVYLFVGLSPSLMLTTDTKGMALFTLDTSLWKHSVYLRVSYCLQWLFLVFWNIAVEAHDMTHWTNHI